MLINRHSLNVEQSGPEHGPVVVLLHHGLGSVKAWRGQIPVLAEAGYRVVAYDRWGYGGSQGRAGLDLPTFASDIQDLCNLLDQLRIKRAALVGHSDGGTIALYFSAQQPHRISCLVSVAAHIYVEPKMEPGIQGIHQDFETNLRFRQGLRSAHGIKYAAVFHHWFDGWRQVGSLSWDMRPVLGKIQCPALIVQGEADEHATPQHARDIVAAIPGAELWLIPGTGHMLPQECTSIFNPRLLQFLEKYAMGT